MKKILIFTFSLAVILPTTASAHPGRTDSSGCHTCRTNCPSWGLATGEYHCHRSKGLPQPLAPIRSIKAEHITVPAPEYATPTSVPLKPNSAVSTSTYKSPVSNQINLDKPVKSEGWMTRFYNFIFK